MTPSDLDQLSDLAADYAIYEARTSQKYILTMSDIVVALNRTNINDLSGIDLDELKSQAGNLVYFNLRSQNNPTPCDVDYLIRLHSHLRRPLLLLLKRTKRHLNSEHRRILSNLERENIMEKVMKPRQFNIDLKVKFAALEMKRHRKMADMVKGGGRKLDILFNSIKIPARIRSEVMIMLRILADRNNNKHVEAIDWINQSENAGDIPAFQNQCMAKIQLLESQSEVVFDLIEDLSGLAINRDFSQLDLDKNWYTLGEATLRGEDFISSFIADDQREQLIKRLTYTMVRIRWDSDRLIAEKDGIILNTRDQASKAEALSRLFMDIQEKITQSVGSKSQVVAAIEADYNRSLLSKSEKKQAYQWVSSNLMKLKELMLDIYDTLSELKQANPDLAVPEELETIIAQVQNSMREDKESHKKQLTQDFSQLDLSCFEQEYRDLLAKKQENPAEFLAQAQQFTARLEKQRNFISIKNVELHRRLRESYPDFIEYENKVMELMKMEEGLEKLRIECEQEVLSLKQAFKLSELKEEPFQWFISLHLNQILLSIKKCDYSSIEADLYSGQFNAALEEEKEETIARLDFIMQIIQGIPKARQLLHALKDWEKDLEEDEINEKKTFIDHNDESLQTLTDNIRNELRENLAGSQYQSRRIRFEVFGFSDYLANSLENSFHALMELAPRAANQRELEHIIKTMENLEAQIIQAQKQTRPQSSAYKHLKELQSKDVIDVQLLSYLEHDLGENFNDLNRILPKVNAGLKKLILMQNRYGAEKDSDYLDITININDIEKLRTLYDFLDEVNMEDIKRFCVAYNLRQTLMTDFFESTRKKDISIPKDLLKLFTAKVYKGFKEKRYIPSRIKYQIYLHNKEIFEAETQLLCHTLNLVKPHRIKNKAAYKNIISILSPAKEAAPWIVKKLGLIWGRTQSRLFKHHVKNHKRNYEGNRTALVNEVKENVGEKFELQL
ncbi:MAG: hypothetical protein CSA81_05870 [Acidobacteria bacterium]|nr:MAG: hypothetical protein CSA81_05870 [Acidobacteriota bacterium]